MLQNLGRRLGRAKGARAFAFEVAIVVIGVLIALGAQQAMDAWTWRERVKVGERRLREEATGNAFYAAEVISTAPCVQKQLDLLAAKLAEEGDWKGIPIFSSPFGAQVIRAPSRPWSFQMYDSLVSDGTLAHFPDERAFATSSAYSMMRQLSDKLRNAEDSRAELNFLASPLPLDRGTRLALLQGVAALKSQTSIADLAARQQLTEVMMIKGRVDGPLVDEWLKKYLKAPASTFEVCKSHGWPLADWKPIIRASIQHHEASDIGAKAPARKN